MKHSVVIKRLGYEASAGWTTYGTSLPALSLFQGIAARYEGSSEKDREWGVGLGNNSPFPTPYSPLPVFSSSAVVQRGDSSGHFPIARAFGGRDWRLRLRALREIDCGDDCGGEASVVAVILRRVPGFSPFEESGDVTRIDLATRELFVVK